MSNKKILYVTTQITSTWRYFSWCAYPSIWYSRIQRKILTILASSDQSNIFIKFYPNDICVNPNIDWVKREFPNLTILNESLYEILHQRNFDLIITEASATSLLEIICTKSKVLAFFPINFIKIFEKDKEQLKKRIILSETPEEYYTCLKQELALARNLKENNPYLESSLNDDFLSSYGFSSAEGDPIILTKQAIKSVTQNSNKQ